MARDEHLLSGATGGAAALRLYGWQPPTISLGYFQRHDDLRTLPAPLQELPVVRRVTGGGAILHDAEITYCLVLDAAHAAGRSSPIVLYRGVHTVWRDVLAADGIVSDLAPDHFPLPTPRSGPFFCFERAGQTDLLLHGAKLLGSAQRRTPQRIMQHGSLILRQRFSEHPGAQLPVAPGQAQLERWRQSFARGVARLLELTPEPLEWRDAWLPAVAALEAKHRSDAWLRLR